MSTHFEIIKTSKKSNARAGILHTAHGSIETPVFMPVGTQATVKAMPPAMLKTIGSQIILANTYHLSLRPGIDVIQKMGGLHQFMSWDQPILTDSGGYQVFSLQGMRKISESGVIFKSHLDGSLKEFTPKSVIDLQVGFGSDIMMPLDICTPYPSEKEQVEKDLEQTYRWEKEAIDYWKTLETPLHLFGLVQGGMYKDLREKSAEGLVNLDFPGYAIGGLSVGEPRELLEEYTAFTAALLPKEKPRYLMGVGLPENMAPAIQAGIDMFDCVAPTRLARHGHFFTTHGNGNIRNKQYEYDPEPLDTHCDCPTCTQFSRAYLRHLFVAKEILAMTLISTHNLFHLLKKVNQIRKDILNETV